MASSKREKELARQRAERQAARRAAAAQRKKQRRAVVASVLAVALVAGVAVATGLAVRGGDGPRDVATASASDPSGAPAAGGCEYVADGEAAKPVEPPPVDAVDEEGVYDVTLTTDRGVVAFEMDSAATPCTANSLRSLATAGYFDDTPCHRLTTSGIKVLQCGDPSGTGTGGPGYSFADENLEGATYPRGTVAMANGGPDTNGSQFFLVYDDSSLPPQYTPFGRITAGLEVLETVAAAGTTSPAGDGAPKLPVTIQTLRAVPRP